MSDDLRERVLRLKRERNAVILAHNYQTADIQEVADFVGDSLGLARHAQAADAEVILFCGVHFMAETAKIVNPDKTVLLPDLAAGCSLADACPAGELEQYLTARPGTYVVSYINCSAAVKALSDVICTSGNAVKIVKQVPADRDILFVPDQNLGEWVTQQTGRAMELWRGNCYVHVEFTHASIQRIRAEYPAAPVIAHPECTRAVRLLADEVCSTERMLDYCRQSPAAAFIIVTESGMLHRLRRELPGKTFIAGPTELCACNDCRFMKLNTLEKMADALETLQPRIELPVEILARARAPLQRMLDWSR
ncbi:MAG: quinolinate synthase NadA [Verrucomicrobiales bacterium]|jgi:quinolinate synthase|nr:quinolinate synthase NadA [Verrucomicrobiales bacterium]